MTKFQGCTLLALYGVCHASSWESPRPDWPLSRVRRWVWARGQALLSLCGTHCLSEPHIALEVGISGTPNIFNTGSSPPCLAR